MKPVLVFGAGQVAEVFAAYLRENDIETGAHVVDAQFLAPDMNAVAFERIAKVCPPEHFRFTVGMSFKGLNRVRAAKYEAMKALGYEPLSFIDHRCRVTGDPQFDHGCFIQDGNCIQPGVSIGENTILWAGNHLGHHSRIGNHVWISSLACISGDCEIGDFTFVGVGATVIDGVKVGKGCIIGAEALITKDVPDDSVIPGPVCIPSVFKASQMRGIWANK